MSEEQLVPSAIILQSMGTMGKDFPLDSASTMMDLSVGSCIFIESMKLSNAMSKRGMERSGGPIDGGDEGGEEHKEQAYFVIHERAVFVTWSNSTWLRMYSNFMEKDTKGYWD